MGFFDDLAKILHYGALYKQVKEAKDVASDDEFETMQDEVERIEHWLNQEEVRKRLVDSSIGNVKKYSKILSVVAMSLVLDYGFKNNVLTTIKLDQYDGKANTLNVNAIIIPLKVKYVGLMELYLKARQVISYLE